MTIQELFNYSHLHSAADEQGIYGIWLTSLLCPLMATQQIMKHDSSCLAQPHTTLSLFVFVCWYQRNTLPEACCSSTSKLCDYKLASANYTTNKTSTTTFYKPSLSFNYSNLAVHSELINRKYLYFCREHVYCKTALTRYVWRLVNAGAFSWSCHASLHCKSRFKFLTCLSEENASFITHECDRMTVHTFAFIIFSSSRLINNWKELPPSLDKHNC